MTNRFLIVCHREMGVVVRRLVLVALVAGMTTFPTAQTQSPSSRPPATPAMPRLTFAFEIHAQVGVPLELGTTALGRRRIIAVNGGTFAGPNLKGKVLPGGADWQVVRADGLTDLDARYTLQTDNGLLIYVQNRGIRHAPPDVMKKLLAGEDVDPALVYFRTAPVFETSAPDLQWLTRSVFVATAERHPSDVIIRVWKIE
ncbi:MAG TPA: DUF3237 domain-containing protein [Vicinamibacterales bacterium]|jgi:hypothetical protein